MRNYNVLIIVLGLFLNFSPLLSQSNKARVEIKNNWYYINGHRFFIKALGYEIGARPGQDPYKDPKPDLGLMRYDLKVIKDAGFNTIRTWTEISEDQLKVVQKSGLKIIFGIWIKPEKNYADPAFVKECEAQVKKAMVYTHKYSCVISYLILNEPMTDHIYKCTAKATVALLTDLESIIHKEDPGIPVSISANAAISDYIDENFLDFYGYNCYDYHDGQGGAMGYSGFLRWVDDMNGKKKPFVITEFGYSVSEDGSGNFGYGGNTLEMQKEGIIHNYRDIIDAGATGLCPFYYADGWWKGGEKDIHNNVPEEWFGFVGYSGLDDSLGSPRPVWYALKNYMTGLVLSPKNQEVYVEKIPLEFYVEKSVKKVIVRYNDKAIYSKKFNEPGYFADQLPIHPEGIQDMELVFEFYDKDDQLIKDESIEVLGSTVPVKLPKLIIAVTPNDLRKSKNCTLKIRIENEKGFQVDDNLRYSFCHHIGWNSGTSAFIPIKFQLQNRIIEVSQDYKVPDACHVLTVSAGVTIKYGKFTKRIHDQRLIYNGNWADGIGEKAQ